MAWHDQLPFPEWWENLLPPARWQHHLWCWGYSHHPSIELLPTHGPVHHNIEPFYLPYHEPPLVVDWQRHMSPFLLDTRLLGHRGKYKSLPASKRDLWPWHRPTSKSPLCRVEATVQLLHPAAASNKVGYGWASQRSLSLEINTTVKPLV